MIKICHIMESTPTEAELESFHESAILLKTLVHESHIFRYILKCRMCGQFYFFEFYEEIDWIEGKDPQYSTYIPVKTIGEAEELNKKSQIGLLGVSPRLQKDFVGDTKTIRWFR